MEHSNTETVPTSSEYRCTGCGETQEFEAGDDFTICDLCGDENAGWEPLAGEGAEEELAGSGDERV